MANKLEFFTCCEITLHIKMKFKTYENNIELKHINMIYDVENINICIFLILRA